MSAVTTGLEAPQESPLARRYRLQDVAAKLLPIERVCKCGRRLAPRAKDVGGQLVEPGTIKVVWRDGRAHYRNLYQCGSIWTCPVCAGRITEERRFELTEAMSVAQQHGYFGLHLIFTLRHHDGDKLIDLLKALKDAKREFKAGRWFNRLKSQYGWRGSITALEVTHGDNGWHPHQHELVFLDSSLSEADEQAFINAVKARWNAVLEHQGYDASWERGLVVETAHSDLADYVAKFGHEPENPIWSPEHEITKNPVKMGRLKGRTPFQLLDDYDHGDARAGRLFQEYARVFKGRKQLQWSNGLRQLLIVGDEIKDSDLLDQSEPDERVLLALFTDEWKRVLVLKLRAPLLDVASAGKSDVLEAWIVARGIRKPQADEHRDTPSIGIRSKPHGSESPDLVACDWMLRHDLENWSRLEWIDRGTGEIVQRE